MSNIRQDKIMNLIENNEVITIKQIQAMFPEVSVMTIHRDLDALAARGHLVKIRGGARAIHCASETQFDVRERENPEGKNVIAKKALQLIQPGSSIFIDAGTTNLTLARSLPDINLTVFTTAPNIALELRHLVNPSINLCCGNLNRANLAVSGYKTLEMLESINIDLAFIGVSGCSLAKGLTCGMETEMLVKRHVIRHARTSVALCDSSKLTRLLPFTFAHLSEVDYIITDGAFPDSFVEGARQAGVTLL